MAEPSAHGGAPEGRELHFAGGLFDEPGFPLARARELAAFQRLLVAVAVRRFREQNPHRQRVPRSKIVESIQMSFAEVQPGSAVLPLLAPRTLGQQDLFSERELWLAVDEVFEAIAIAATGGDLVDRSVDEVESLRQFGSSWRDDERIEFDWKGRPIRYGVPERERLLQSTADTSDDVVESLLIGWVKMLDVAGRFELVTADDKRINGNYSSELVFADLHDAQTIESEDRPLVWLDCRWKRDPSTAGPKSVLDVQRAGRFIASDTPRMDRLSEIAALPDGWLEGDGSRVQIDVIERAAEILTAVGAEGISLPGVFPGVDGEVRLEWGSAAAHLVLRVRADLGFAWHITRIDHDTVHGSSPDLRVAIDAVRGALADA